MPEDKTVRLKRHYSVVAHSANLVELRHGTWNAVSLMLSDESNSEALLRVVSRLDGTLSPREIAAAEEVPESEVEMLLGHLSQLGALEEGPANALDYYLDHAIPNLAPYGERRERKASPVLLIGDDAVTEEIGRALGSGGAGAELDVRTADPEARRLLAGAASWGDDGLAFEEAAEAFAAWQGQLVVYARATLDPLALRALNRLSLHHGFPWVQAAADGPFLLVGPTFLPLRSACYECLEGRVAMNLREGASYENYKRALAAGHTAAATAPLDRVLGAMLASHTAFEALNFALTGASFTIGKLLAIYLPTMEFTFNEVLRLPGCRACGPRPESDDRELYFELTTILAGGGSENGRVAP
jgi:bacteriocin biosynthesis cyclodehydratase domain-containing protein